MSVFRPNWLMGRPIAHRGLHDPALNIVENSRAAAESAIARGCAIECDVQITADGEAVVFHDFTLERLTGGAGRVDQTTAAQFAATPLRNASEAPPTLKEFCAVIGRRTPLICEIKSRFDGDLRLAKRVAEVTAAYAGPLAIKSFDPAVMTFLNRNRRQLGIRYTPLGMVAQAHYDGPDEDWSHLDAAARYALANFLHYRETVPDFISYRVDDLPGAVPYLCRSGIGIPLMAWTVRTDEQAAKARQWADQVIFEGRAAA